MAVPFVRRAFVHVRDVLLRVHQLELRRRLLKTRGGVDRELGFPATPRLVVIITTPFEPRDP